MKFYNKMILLYVSIMAHANAEEPVFASIFPHQYFIGTFIGIPYAPLRHYFKNGGELKQFVLLFPPIPKFWKTFHLVECAGSGSFRVRDIERKDSGIYHIQLT